LRVVLRVNQANIQDSRVIMQDSCNSGTKYLYVCLKKPSKVCQGIGIIDYDITHKNHDSRCCRMPVEGIAWKLYTKKIATVALTTASVSKWTTLIENSGIPFNILA
jgi:hypothetical protein